MRNRLRYSTIYAELNYYYWLVAAYCIEKSEITTNWNDDRRFAIIWFLWTSHAFLFQEKKLKKT